MTDYSSSPNIRAVKYILQQPFTYLSEGSRVFVFISGDGQYVLKLLKTPEGINAQFRSWGIDLGNVEWSPQPGNALGAAKALFNQSLQSYQLAFKNLKTETGLVYIHFSKTRDLNTKFTLGDGVLDLDSVPFLIQRNAELLQDRIVKLMKEGAAKKAEQVLDELLNLIIHIWQKGITEDTYNFHTNYGYEKDGRLIQIDAGEFYEDSQKVLEEIRDKKILKKESYQWLENTYPDLASHLVLQVTRKFNADFIGLNRFSSTKSQSRGQ